MSRSFLIFVALVFVGYGLACAIDPALPARLAGLSIVTADGYAEMGAMYGGLQIGVGLFCLFGAMQQQLTRPALLLLVLSIGPLAAMRGISALRIEDAIGSYTLGALAFESLVTAIAALLVRRPAP
jgi:hypothetical protein